MKKLLALPVLFLLIISCNNGIEKPLKTEKEISLLLYLIRDNVAIKNVDLDTLPYFGKDSLTLRKIVFSDSVVFYYPYRHLMDYTDTLIIKNDKVNLRQELKYLSQKAIALNGKPVTVKKYSQDVLPTGPMGNIFINDSLGIVMSRTLAHPNSMHINCYDTHNLKELHMAIAADRSFFEFKTD